MQAAHDQNDAEQVEHKLYAPQSLARPFCAFYVGLNRFAANFNSKPPVRSISFPRPIRPAPNMHMLL